MNIKSLPAYLLIALVSTASLANAQVITYTQDFRSVSYERTREDPFSGQLFSPVFSQSASASNFDPLNVIFAGADFTPPDPFGLGVTPILGPPVAASQSSSLNFNGITASGSTDASLLFDDPSAQVTTRDVATSSFFVAFDLSEDADFTLDLSSTGNIGVSVTEVGNGTNIASIFPGGSITESGVLEAGQYEVFVDSFGNGSFDIAFTIAAVPEPSSCSFLLGAALFGLSVRRRS